MTPEAFPSRRAGQVVRMPAGYWVFVPHPLPPTIDYTLPLIRLLAEARGALGELAGLGRMLPNPHLLVSPAIHREAVLSSRIEGTQADLEDLYLFEADPGETPRRSDVREVHNYVTALEYGLQRLEALPISLRLLREIHERLMAGVRGGHVAPGQFRTTQNWIGRPGCLLTEATYVPPPVDSMTEALGHWEQYLHTPDETSELVRLALTHYQFEAIHPFVDGNGRLGRLLIGLLLCHWQLLPQPLLYLSAFFEAHRDEYYRSLLRVSQHGEWENWIEFFLLGMREQSRDAVRTARMLIDLQAHFHAMLRGQSHTKATPEVLDHLFAHPVVTASLIRDRLQVNFRTAQNAIRDLEQAGLLREVTGQRRNRVWIAPEIMRILTGGHSEVHG